MQGVHQFGALAETAAVLSQQLQAQLKWLAQALAPKLKSLDRKFLRRLQELGYSAGQQASLVEITPGAAASLLAGGAPVSEFLESVRYRGRRLAKLDLTPDSVVAALREYDRLLDEAGRAAFEPRQADLAWARNQLHFLVVLTLHDAYYLVREAESRTFYELFRAQTESLSLEEMWRRFLSILSIYTGAAEAGLFLREGKDRWKVAAGAPAVVKARAIESPGTARAAACARILMAGTPAFRHVLAPSWAGRYATVWSVPLGSSGEVRGLLQFAFRKAYEWLPRELKLLEDAAGRCWQAAEKARLLEEIAVREEQVRRLAEHMVEVEEAERRRISRELHDEAGQSLLCIRLQLEMLEQQLPLDEARLRHNLSGLREMTEHSIVEIRRLIAALSPAILEQMGLAAALRQLAGRFRQIHPAAVQVQIPRRLDLPKKVEIILYRLVQEALNNIAKYSLASHVNLSLQSADGMLTLHIEDDGVGFDVEEAFSRRECYGLSGLRERVALLGGTLSVSSVRKPAGSGETKATVEPRGRRRKVDRAPRRHGTAITVRLPLESRPDETRAGSGRRQNTGNRAAGVKSRGTQTRPVQGN